MVLSKLYKENINTNDNKLLEQKCEYLNNIQEIFEGLKEQKSDLDEYQIGEVLFNEMPRPINTDRNYKYRF